MKTSCVAKFSITLLLIICIESDGVPLRRTNKNKVVYEKYIRRNPWNNDLDVMEIFHTRNKPPAEVNLDNENAILCVFDPNLEACKGQTQDHRAKGTIPPILARTTTPKMMTTTSRTTTPKMMTTTSRTTTPKMMTTTSTTTTSSSILKWETLKQTTSTTPTTTTSSTTTELDLIPSVDLTYEDLYNTKDQKDYTEQQNNDEDDYYDDENDTDDGYNDTEDDYNSNNNYKHERVVSNEIGNNIPDLLQSTANPEVSDSKKAEAEPKNVQKASSWFFG